MILKQPGRENLPAPRFRATHSGVGRIIGIDLGTTKSCAAYRTEEGQIKIIPYKGGDYTVPSIFTIDDKGQELVGYEAKRQWQLNPRKTVYGAKRLVGRAFHSDVVARMQKYVSYQIAAGAGVLDP